MLCSSERGWEQTGHPEILNTHITYSISPYPETLKPTLHLDLMFQRHPTAYTYPTTIYFPFHSNERTNFQKARQQPTAEINHNWAGDEHYPERNNLAKISPLPRLLKPITIQLFSRHYKWWSNHRASLGGKAESFGKGDVNQQGGPTEKHRKGGTPP